MSAQLTIVGGMNSGVKRNVSALPVENGGNVMYNEQGNN